MRYAPLIVLLLALAGCSSDKPKASSNDSGTGRADGGQADAGSVMRDAGTGKADSGTSKLERPNTLPRPPRTGLPAELRPPR
jgi:hypothetical protein